MKKRITLFLVTCMFLVSMVGCTTEQKSYLNETKRVASWEAFDSTAKVSMDVTAPKFEPQMEGAETQAVPTQEKMHFDFDVKGYTLNEKGKKQKGYALLNAKDDKGNFQIKDVKIFVDGQDVYISKHYMEDIMKYSAKKELPKRVTDVKQEYILISNDMNELLTGEAMTPASGVFMQDYMDTMTNPEKRDELLQKMSKVLDLIEFDVPVKKEGNATYTMKLESDEFIDKAVNSIDKAVLNLNQIITILELKDMVPKEVKLSELQEQYKNSGKKQIMDAVPMAKEALKGSSFQTKETFTEDKYTSDSKIDIVVNAGFAFKLNMNVKSESKKAEKKEIKVPTRADAISLKDYMELYLPPIKDTFTLDTKAKVLKSEKTGTQITLKTLATKDGQTMYEFAPIVRSFGVEVGYDQKAYKVYYMNHGQKEYVEDAVEKNGITYILPQDIDYRWVSDTMTEDGGAAYRYVIREKE